MPDEDVPRRLKRFNRNAADSGYGTPTESYDYRGIEKISRREKQASEKAPAEIREDIIKKMRDERAAQKEKEDAERQAKENGTAEKKPGEKKPGIFSGLFGMFGKKGNANAENEPQKLRLRPGQIEVQGEMLEKSEKKPAASQGSAGAGARGLSEKEKDIEAKKIYREIKGLDHVRERTREIANDKVREFKDAHGRNPSDNEFDEMAGDIYGQLKEEYADMPWPEKEKQEKGAVRGRHERPQKTPAENAPQKKDEKQLSPRERVMLRKQKGGEAEPGKKEDANAKKGNEKDALPSPENIKDVLKEEHDALSDLGEMEGESDELAELGGEEEMPEIEGGENLEDIEEEPKEKKSAALKCPKCGKETADVVYCPNCGTGFCEKCAKAAEKQQGAIKYTCPKCGTGFKVKSR